MTTQTMLSQSIFFPTLFSCLEAAAGNRPRTMATRAKTKNGKYMANSFPGALPDSTISPNTADCKITTNPQKIHH